MAKKKLRSLNKFIVLILFSTYLYSCSLKSEAIFKNCEIELLAQDDSIVPSQYSSFDFFCKGKENNVVKLQYRELKEVHQNQFKNLDYTDYLFKLLNQEIIIETDTQYYFKLNDTICKEYARCDFDTFLGTYCNKIDNGKYQLTKSLSENKLNTFSYFLFVNGYFVTFNDYSGFYRITYKRNIFYCD